MRYRSMAASAVVVLGLAACKGNDARMSDDLAKDLAAARTSDVLALAPHAGTQTVVSAEELSPEGRAKLAASRKSSRAVRRRAPLRDRVTAAAATQTAPVRTAAVADAPAPAPAAAAPVQTSDASTTVATAPSPRPEPVDIPATSTYPGPTRGDGGGSGVGGLGGWGGVIGAIGGAILRGGVVDGDHCDPRGRHGGGILINQRGPILRGRF